MAEKDIVEAITEYKKYEPYIEPIKVTPRKFNRYEGYSKDNHHISFTRAELKEKR